MRKITSHKVNGLNDELEISVLDESGAGGANHEYAIEAGRDGEQSRTVSKVFRFQNGPIKESGVNGISGESLIAIVIDRLECFQKGPYACRENALALTKLQEAMHWLHHRTRDRESRGVEGTLQK